jgi:hypothetical protein
MTDQLPRHKPDQVAPKPGPMIVHMRPNLGHPDPEGFLEDLAAPAPTGAATMADPAPASVLGEAMGMAPAAPAPGVASRADAGSDAAGSGRPLQVQEAPAMVVDVPFDPTRQRTDLHGAPLAAVDAEDAYQRAAEAEIAGPDDHVHLSQFEALRVCTALSEVVLRLQRPVVHAADKQACAETLLLIRDQLTVRADQAHLAAWGIQRDGAA